MKYLHKYCILFYDSSETLHSFYININIKVLGNKYHPSVTSVSVWNQIINDERKLLIASVLGEM